MSHRTADGERVNGWHGQFAGGNGERGQGRKGEKCPKKRLTTNGTPGQSVKKTTRRCTRGRLGGDTIQETMYAPPVLANPGVLVQGIKVGGGLMGHQLAHENEAPFPQKLAEWFIRGWCPPAGSVLDPFSGSGTTVAAAMKLGRKGYGTDIRESQCVLGRQRCQDVQGELY